MRRTYTSGSGYYDRSLLEDGKAIPLRYEVPKEHSEVDPEIMLPRVGGPTMTLGDFLGVDPGAYERVLSNNRQSGSVGYNPNTPGVYRTWDGGRDFSLDNSSIDNLLVRFIGSSHPFSRTLRRKRQPFPQLPLPMDNPFNDNRTQEEIGHDLRNALNTTRYNFRDSQSYILDFSTICWVISLCSTIFYHPIPHKKGFFSCFSV